MFGEQFANNVNNIVSKNSKIYICDTYFTSSQLHFVFRKKISTGTDKLLERFSKDQENFINLINKLAIDTVPEYVENSIRLNFINNSIEGTLLLNDHISKDFMFIYDEHIFV